MSIGLAERFAQVRREHQTPAQRLPHFRPQETGSGERANMDRFRAISQSRSASLFRNRQQRTIALRGTPSFVMLDANP